MSKEVHIHNNKRGDTKPLCGIKGFVFTTFQDIKGRWILDKPTCEACILMYFSENKNDNTHI